MTYYEALRLRIRLERAGSGMMTLLIGVAIGAAIYLVDQPWFYIGVELALVVGMVLVWAASSGLQKRIDDGEFDKEDSTP